MEFFTSAQGCSLHLSDSQTGEPVLLLLHGYLESLDVWEDFLPLLPASLRIVCLDLPGHGLSVGRKDVNGMAFSALAIYGALQSCGVKEAYVCGHSLGCYVALEMARQFPDFVQGLALLYGAPYADSEERKGEREISAIEKGKLARVAALSIPKMFAVRRQKALSEKIEEMIELCEVHEPEGIIACLRGMGERADHTEFLNTFAKPLLWIFGKKDRFILEEQAQCILRNFPQGQGILLEGVGHCCFLEEAQATAASIKSWIGV